MEKDIEFIKLHLMNENINNMINKITLNQVNNNASLLSTLNSYSTELNKKILNIIKDYCEKEK